MSSLRLMLRGQSLLAKASKRTPLSSVRAFATQAPKATPPHASESFLSGSNSIVIEELFEKWRADRSSVHSSWDTFFTNLEAGLPPGQAYPLMSYQRPASASGSAATATAGSVTSSELEKAIADTSRINLLIRSFRVRGHLRAKLDPLDLEKRPYLDYPELDPRTYGFTAADMERKFYVHLSKEGQFEWYTLRQILEKLETTYCKNIGIEYYHIINSTQRDWIASKFEGVTPASEISQEEKKEILKHLAEADKFEHFLANKYNTAKRFGLEGGEATIPGLEMVISRAAEMGIENVVLGMAHRGRLNVLGNIVKKPLRAIFHEFQDNKNLDKSLVEGSGDVKYHLGTSTDRVLSNGKKVHLSLSANPSHLEAVNPVVEGKTRAKQHWSNDHSRSKSMSVLLHGDAAFSGQGLVAETLFLSELTNYSTGGTIHIITNNQIGFTTDPKNSRATPYATDVAKSIFAPIFHVNGDDPVAVAYVCKVAAEWRQTFHRDVVIDIVCYRRHGHNELDQPAFTQPQMYKKIAKHPSTLQITIDRFVKEGVISKEEAEGIVSDVEANLNKEFAESRAFVPKPGDWLEKNWKGLKGRRQRATPQQTGLNTATLKAVGEAITKIPSEMVLHPGIARVYQQRKQMVEKGENIDWGFAEALAFGTLVNEGFPVRLSGQDVERGTFSHRHALVHDQETAEDKTYIPLAHVSPKQAPFRVSNSSLSEAAVLGFEHGYSLEHPNALVLWEAQFGDFANGAQVLIDQFISSGEAKWLRQSGLVMLLPHGYDGQGPEHSSCRIERYLQSSDESADVFAEDPLKQLQECNMQICNITTPANYFHALRRQLHREFRKPLIIASPKKLLRYPQCISTIADFAPEVTFQRLIPETEQLVADKEVRRVVFCSGQVYYDLLKARTEAGIKNIALVRVEQLNPFPFDLVSQQIAKYSNAEIAWAQEEPMNMGGYQHVMPRFMTCLRTLGQVPDISKLRYIGRAAAASPATGFSSTHAQEQKYIVDTAMAL